MMNKYTKVILLCLIFLNFSCIKRIDEDTKSLKKTTPIPEKPYVNTISDLVVPSDLKLNPTYLFTIEISSSSESEKYISICYERLTAFEENCIFKGRFHKKEISQTVSINNPSRDLVIIYINFNQQVDKQEHKWSYMPKEENLLTLYDNIYGKRI